MSTTTDVVRENAAYHAQLLAAVAELDYIPSAVEQQDSYIAGLENQLRLLGPKIASLEMQTKKEREEHEALRDSATRRFAATITGRKDKYEAKASKEEREYVEALEKEMQHKRQQGALETMIREAKTLRRDLQSKLERYNKAKQDLTTLYSKIFDGPTQAFPEDDQLEYQLQQAQDRYNEIQGYLNRESQAVNLLQSAYDALQSCYSQMKEAIDDSHWDMFGGFGAVDDIMERQDLRAAQEKATQAQMFVQQAMMISPQVQPVGEITIAQGSLVTDVFFDNIFTDMAFHQKIIASKRNVQDVQINVMNQLRFAQGRAGAIGADLNVAADALAHARGELDAFRRRVFDGMAGNGHGDENKHVPPLAAPTGPPPGYSATEAGPPSQVSGPSSSFTPPPGQPLSLPSQIPMITNSYAPPPGPPPPGSRAASPSAWSGHCAQPPPPGYPAREPEPAGNNHNHAPPSSTYAPPPGPPPPTDPEQGGDLPLPPPMYSAYAVPPGPPPPQVSTSTSAYAPLLEPPSANSRAASPSAWAPPVGPPPGHSAAPATIPLRPELTNAHSHPSSYAPPPGPPPPLPPARSRPASPSSFGARNANPAYPLPPPQPLESTRPLGLPSANSRAASPSAGNSRNAQPPENPATPMPSMPEPYSALLQALQPTSGYAPPPGPPPPRGPESSSSYSAPLGPPPADSRASSPSPALASHNRGLAPTNSTSPRPTTNSTSPRPPAGGIAASGPFPLPRASQSAGGYAPPPGPPQHLHPESGSLERPRAASPSAWGHRNPYAAALATGGGR